MTLLDLAFRFPGLSDGWSRFDGPAGTQVVDTAIEAIARSLASPATANGHGPFPQSAACDAAVDHARDAVGRLLGTPDGGAGIVFGPSMTGLVFNLTRTLAATDLGPATNVVGTTLDHDANVSPWALACSTSGAELRLARFDPDTGRLDHDHLTRCLDLGTRWVAVTGASNALGTRPDLPAVIAAAKEVGARVLVDGVHLTPHARIDVAALGCDAYVCSAYKWYGPHLGVLWLAPDLVEGLPPTKVRPSPATGPGRWEQGTPAFELLAGAAAAAEFVLDVTPEAIAAHEAEVFAGLLDGLHALPRVRVWGPQDAFARTPTVALTVEGHTPLGVARHLATHHCAAWAGDYYAVEAMAALGLAGAGGAVRLGLACYSTPADVARVLEALAALA